MQKPSQGLVHPGTEGTGHDGVAARECRALHASVCNSAFVGLEMRKREVPVVILSRGSPQGSPGDGEGAAADGAGSGYLLSAQARYTSSPSNTYNLCLTTN